MLKLPDVTLVCVETREHELAGMAIADCLRVATFGDVLVLTDRPERFGIWMAKPFGDEPQQTCLNQPVRYHKVPDWPEKIGWSRSWWYDVPPLLRTRQTLNIQWDSWICDATMWNDAFLDYDYIGAPWWYKDGMNVGNGGFSLVSTRLKRFLRSRRSLFPCDTNTDDDLLCRKYRPALEEFGFRWAPEPVAHQFAFECRRPSKTSLHFGFHAMFNWPEVLGPIALEERMSIALNSPYIANSYMMEAFCKAHPDIVKSLVIKSGHEDLLTTKGANYA